MSVFKQLQLGLTTQAGLYPIQRRNDNDNASKVIIDKQWRPNDSMNFDFIVLPKRNSNGFKYKYGKKFSPKDKQLC